MRARRVQKVMGRDNRSGVSGDGSRVKQGKSRESGDGSGRGKA